MTTKKICGKAGASSGTQTIQAASPTQTNILQFVLRIIIKIKALVQDPGKGIALGHNRVNRVMGEGRKPPNSQKLLILQETPFDFTSRQSWIFISMSSRDKLTAGVNDTSGQFAAGVNNTAGDDIVD